MTFEVLDTEHHTNKPSGARKVVLTVLTGIATVVACLCFRVFQSPPGLGYLIFVYLGAGMIPFAIAITALAKGTVLRIVAVITSFGTAGGPLLVILADQNNHSTMITGQVVAASLVAGNILLIILVWLPSRH